MLGWARDDWPFAPMRLLHVGTVYREFAELHRSMESVLMANRAPRGQTPGGPGLLAGSVAGLLALAVQLGRPPAPRPSRQTAAGAPRLGAADRSMALGHSLGRTVALAARLGGAVARQRTPRSPGLCAAHRLLMRCMREPQERDSGCLPCPGGALGRPPMSQVAAVRRWHYSGLAFPASILNPGSGI